MIQPGPFRGFSDKTVKFLAELAQNNTKEWFSRNRAVYDAEVMTPARAFVEEMGKRLEFIVPGIHAEPKVNRSIFRISRDTRFAKDKSPYKNHLGLWFWQGEGPRMECSGFYFHLEPPNLLFGAGLHCFPRSLLHLFRQAVVDPKKGKALTGALAEIKAKGDYAFGVEHYKRIPKGFDPKHPNAPYLLFNGLTARVVSPIPDELYSPDLVDYFASFIVDALPLHLWLSPLAEQAKSSA